MRRRKLTRVREGKNLTQQALADRAGVSWMTISRLERGENQAREGTRRALCKALRWPWAKQGQLFGAMPKFGQQS